MKSSLAWLAGLWLAVSVAGAEPRRLFDGQSLAGWNGDTRTTWRIEQGVIVGGSLTQTVPRNEFLATDRAFTNFVLRLQFKLSGTEGFVNSGVQIRSQRVPNHHEMAGYQADIGPGWYGCIYDESRRNKVLAKPSDEAVAAAVKPGAWNDYEIRCEGRRVRLRLNGREMVDYTEADESLAQHGVIGLQVHGGGKTEVRFKDLTIEELP
ncbi:MAG: DUF1080 domain-containing protein [Verrucomicrobiota bacterium]